MKKPGIAAVIVLTACIMIFIVSGCSSREPQGDALTEPIKSNDEYLDVCSEEIISRSEKISAAADLKRTFDQKEFKELFGALAYGFVNEKSTSMLYDENGCFLSISSAAFFDVASNQTSDVIQCFIFTKDLEEAGTIRFLKDDIRTMSVSINDTEAGGHSVVLEKLAGDKDRKYVLLTNGMDTKLLDNENNIVNVGRQRHDLEIVGDCYSVLEQGGLGISYSDITCEENLIWFEFDK